LHFAKKQADYALGSSGRSYVVGFGVNPPQHPHHRTAHSSWCVYGALVGGPDASDAYVDDIGNYVTNEVACDYNAGFVGLLAKMYEKYGGNPIPNFMAIEEKTNEEIYVEATANSNNGVELKTYLYNKSGWPARVCDKLSFRYFMDLTEYNDITVSIIYSAAPKISKPILYDASKNIYYCEIDLSGTKIFPGSNSDHQKETQFRIQPPAGAPWDNTNDFSYQGIKKNGEVVKEMPVYEDGETVRKSFTFTYANIGYSLR